MKEKYFKISVEGVVVGKIAVNDLIAKSYIPENFEKRKSLLVNLGDLVFREAIKQFQKE